MEADTNISKKEMVTKRKHNKSKVKYSETKLNGIKVQFEGLFADLRRELLQKGFR